LQINLIRVLLTLCAMQTSPAHAQHVQSAHDYPFYPSRPIRFIAPTSPGVATDVLVLVVHPTMAAQSVQN
jgi:tripartite-type tricarboxylate transporter receptor subunit TctC